MYCWHYKLIPTLDDDLLRNQLDDCVRIADILRHRTSTDDLLIEAVRKYPIQQFRDYCNMVVFELNRRGIHTQNSTIQEIDSYIGFEYDMTVLHNDVFPGWHDDDKLADDWASAYESDFMYLLEG